MMPATVKVNRLETHRPNLKTGVESFRFRCHSELLGLANTNTQLPGTALLICKFVYYDYLFKNNHPTDIVGEITAVKSTVTDPPQNNNRLMATIKMDNDVSVTMSLFDSQAVKLHKQLESMGGDPRVLVAASINPKIVGGRLFLNATSGTHIYFDKETTAGETYFYRLVAQDTGLPSAAPFLKSYAKVESLRIAELNEFVISASSQAGNGVNPEDTEAPPFVAGMEGRPTRSSECDRMPLSQFVDNGGDDDNGDNNSGPSRFVLRWRLVVAVRCKDPQKLRRMP
ncbi:unnamed protein product [Brassica napus]|uniref:(rape) hypothetical protein n=1 Tax=Brassica napus TaxID=3708 RepID=A0A816YJ91_BRANA|nr:unnamed protein product [Brassica napus]